ncbi:MAG: hypothetical protein R3336_00830 [Phycisphaeraceae bacterium]|nr:hypothetical protein [Phycisphaeraceae bacterium]
MSRQTLAGYVLTASAFVLTGLLLSQLHQLTPTAEADMISNPSNNLSMMTVRSADEHETLILLDSAGNRLLAFDVDLSVRGGQGIGRIEFNGQADLTQVFSTGGSGNRGRRGR